MAGATEVIVGRNSVLEALKAGRSINKIVIDKGEKHGSVREIIARAKDLGLVVQSVDGAKLQQLSGGVKHQGVAALVAPAEYVQVEDILRKSKELNELPFLALLEEINDPHNVGAILRTAEAVGVHGLILTKRRSCPLTQAVAKTSAGAINHVGVARITNVAASLKSLKKEGLWVVGADLNGSELYYEADFSRPLLIVIGGEGEGMSRLTKENCDFLVRIPMVGKVSSLNASVACALLFYEVLRQRGK